jgi:hypothetical protein
VRLDHSPGIIINANPQHRASLQESSIKQSPLIYRPAIKNDSDAICVREGGRTIWVADAHRGDGKRFVVRADDKLAAFAELEAEISHVQESAEPVAAYQARPHKNLIKLRYNSANCLKQVIFCANSTRT